MCSNGYPEKFHKDILIKDIDKIKLGHDEFCFHAGTKTIGKETYSAGGRVLNFVSLSENFNISRKKIFSLINLLNWSGGFFRKDIGHKVIK